MADLLLQLQRTLGDRYTIEREIGHGGTALVYLAQDRKHPRRVAIKVLRPDLAAAIGPERFLREIEIAARLSHSHILPLFDSGATEALAYYVMPLVDGESLRNRLTREGQLSLAETLRIAGQVVGALDYAHQHGVVHRDIKPENILLANGEVQVADFGVARAIDSAGVDRLTETGMAVGTPAYMSPEQGAGDTRIDGRTDVYALGCVVYEMLAGQAPFTAPSPQALIARHALDPVPPLRTIRPDLPEGVGRAVLKALAKAPADRFESAGAFNTALVAGATEPPRRPDNRKLLVGSAALGLALVGIALLLVTRSRSSVEEDRSIAVLPFDNIGGDSSDEYFSDGMAEELTAALGKISGLRVIPRTSAFSFKHKAITAPEIGRALQVRWLLHGAVRRSANQFRITPELILAARDSQVWSEEYAPRDVRDVFAVQDEISHAIVGALQLHLTAAGAPLVRRSTASPEAHDLYLKGRFFLGQRSGESLRKSAEYFAAAIATDSDYASAYSGLSDALSIQSIFGYVAPEQTFPRAKAAAIRALELDSTLAEAQTSLGIISIWYDGDRWAAERELTQAVALDPRYPPAHLFYAWLLTYTGRTTLAIQEVTHARELDPLSIIINTRVATMLYNARRYPEAIAQLRRALDLDSTNALAHVELARTWMAQGRCDEALAATRAIPAAFPNYEGYITGYADARCGRRAEATRLIRDLEANAVPSDAKYLRIAGIYTGLGERDSAYAWLGRLRPSLWLGAFSSDPLFDPLRGDARYAPLVRRVGLEP